MALANKIIVCSKCGGTVESRDEAFRTDKLDYLCSDCHIDSVLEQMYKSTSIIDADDNDNF